jgi:hypothetical protein
MRLHFLEASQHFLFYRVGSLAPRPTPIPEDQASGFISPRGRVATHFSRLLRHAWVTVGIFLSCRIFVEFKTTWQSGESIFSFVSDGDN